MYALKAIKDTHRDTILANSAGDAVLTEDEVLDAALLSEKDLVEFFTPLIEFVQSPWAPRQQRRTSLVTNQWSLSEARNVCCALVGL
jgi:hypothetical protein